MQEMRGKSVQLAPVFLLRTGRSQGAGELPGQDAKGENMREPNKTGWEMSDEELCDAIWFAQQGDTSTDMANGFRALFPAQQPTELSEVRARIAVLAPAVSALVDAMDADMPTVGKALWTASENLSELVEREKELTNATRKA